MRELGLAGLTLSAAAAAIADKSVSSRELTEACLARFESYGLALNCVAGLDPQAALAAADAADAERAAGRRRGPLHGVPLAHKDMFYRAGRESACGSRIRAGYLPDETATVLRRLDAAGALDIARLNMVEFALGTTGHSEITGAVRNPWKAAHITGGSSSGSAAAVAARLVYGALGSDTGGSIRLPASCCGLVGLKPTYGRVSRHACMPLSFTLDHVGPLTRSVADAALLLQVIAGADPQDPTSSSRPVPDYSAGLDKGVRGLRIAVPENFFYDPVAAPVAHRVRASLEVFTALGAEVVPLAMPREITDANALNMLITAVEGASFHANWLRTRRAEYGQQTLGRLLPGLLHPAQQYLEAMKLRAVVLARLQETVFARADLLHTPVFPYEVPEIEASDVATNPGFLEFLAGTGHCVRPFNYTGLPAISVPAGVTANGLPTGFQLVGRPFDEPTLLRAAAAYERETRFSTQAPPLP